MRRREVRILVLALAAFAAFGLAVSNSAEAEIDIKIVRGYEGMARYAAAAVGKDLAQRAVLYDKFVNKPYRDVCHREIEGYSDAEQRLTTPIDGLDDLANAVNAIIEYDVESRVIDAIRKSARVLPSNHVTVCLFPYSPDGDGADFVRNNMEGVMGFSEAHGILWIEPIPAKGWMKRLPYTTAHEYHHAIGAFNTNHPVQHHESLLATMIAEGRADTFAELLFPGLQQLWTDTLSDEEERTTWGAMQPYLGNTDGETVFKFVFGDEESGIPPTAGYTIGYRIAQSYIANNPKDSPVEWTALDAKDFLKGSGYAPMSTD
jgi:uncharacterized protein YjaZ